MNARLFANLRRRRKPAPRTAEIALYRAATVVAMDRRLLGDRRPCTGPAAATKAGCWQAGVIQAARAWGVVPA